MFFIRLFLANTKKQIGSHRARLIEKEHYFAIELKFEGNLLCFVCARAYAPKILRNTDAQCNAKEFPGNYKGSVLTDPMFFV